MTVLVPAAEQMCIELYGHFDLQCGLRVSALNLRRILQSRGQSVRLHSLDAQRETSVERPLGCTDVNLFHINPGEFNSLLVHRHEDPSFEARMNVMMPYWELERIPVFWEPVLAGMDVILAPTTFVRDAVLRSLPDATVLLLPQAVEDLGAASSRERFGLPEQAFVAGFAFGAEAIWERKNPLAVVEAFLRAFPDDENARLIVRAAPGGNRAAAEAVWATIREAAGGDPRVLVPTEPWDYATTLSFYASLDLYVSLHRAEGLGLGLMECMSVGTPVMATGWSGNVDFMNDQNSVLVDFSLVPVRVPDSSPYSPRSIGREAVWAEPDIADAARKMRALAEAPARRAALAARAKSDMRTRRDEAERGSIVEQLSTVLEIHGKGREHARRAAVLRGLERRARMTGTYRRVRTAAGTVLRRLHLRR